VVWADWLKSSIKNRFVWFILAEFSGIGGEDIYMKDLSTDQAIPVAVTPTLKGRSCLRENTLIWSECGGKGLCKGLEINSL